jgi:hypothetical protein
MSPAFQMSGMEPDDRPNYTEVIGSPLADAFKNRGGHLRGGISINGVNFNNFETNSPENLVAQINAKFAETGVFAEIDEGGALKLSHRSDAPIRIAKGANYQPPRQGDTLPPAYEENTVLEDLGLDETTEENEAIAAQNALGEGRVPQVGDGFVAPALQPRAAADRQFQTADEIEAMNRGIMQNHRGGISGPIGSNAGGRAPHQPHESVPGTLTTGNRPMPVAPDSNARRVEVPPGQETALGTQPVRADSLVGSAAAPGPTSGDANQQAAPADYEAMTVAELREHADKTGADLTGLTLKDDIIKAVKKNDKAKAK